MNRDRQNVRCKDKGCSLVEAMVALSILSTVLAGSLGLFDITERGIAAGAKSLAMTALVESRMEALRTTPYQFLLSLTLTETRRRIWSFTKSAVGNFRDSKQSTEFC